MKDVKGMEVGLHSFLNSLPDGDDFSSCICHLIPTG